MEAAGATTAVETARALGVIGHDDHFPPDLQDRAIGHGFRQVGAGQPLLGVDGADAQDHLIRAQFAQRQFGDVTQQRHLAVAQDAAQANDRDVASICQLIHHQQRIGNDGEAALAAQAARHFQHRRAAAQKDRLAVTDEIGGRLPDARFLRGLFGGALQDRRLRQSLPHGDRAAVHALHLALIGQCLQVAARGGEADVEVLDDLIDA